MAVLHIGPEVLTVFCPQCKCCLAEQSHCGTCHTKRAITTLCGCGNCFAKAQDYIEREAIRERAREAISMLERRSASG